MTEPSPTPDSPGFHLDPRVVRAFARFTGGFWTGPTARRAWGLTLGLVVFLVLSTGATVALNAWNRWFFDALENRDVATVARSAAVFCLIIVAMSAIGVAIVLTRETLQVRWRQWLVEHLIARWLGRQRFYHMHADGTEPPNPEYRISDDTRWATEPLVDIVIGFVLAVIGATAFISILWSVGGSYTLVAGGMSITIPGYMVVVALAYGAIASGLMLWIGRPLVGYVGRKNEAEGYFRFAMMRLRDNAESVALMRGAPHEQAVLGRFYERIVERWLAIVHQHGVLTWVTNASGPMIPVVPLLFAAPKYLSGDMSLGQVTQLAAAFVQVQLAISWVVDNYNRIAEWYASARRVMDIVDACDAIDTRLPAEPASGAPAKTALEAALAAAAPLAAANGHLHIDDIGLEMRAGEAVHISGDSSVGKSTLVRALSGLSPAQGRSLTLPDTAGTVMIVPQRAYLPLGSLRDALSYPDPALAADDSVLAAALENVGLSAIAGRLREVARWDQLLSAGERQRLAIARALVHRPCVVILDDALGALEPATQARLLRQLRAALPQAAILSLGQRAAAPGFHDRQLVLERQGGGAALRPFGVELGTA